MSRDSNKPIQSTSTIKTYYQLTKPGIIYGNLLNSIAGFLLASGQHIDFDLLLATLLGIALVVACGCVYNNYIDRGIDSNMARTRKRALVAGTIPTRAALVYGTVLGVLGFVVLALFTNILTVALGAIALFVYVVVYGITKRQTVHGTLVGSIAGALPPMAGYVAARGGIDAGALVLFLIIALWQMPHFYAIAMFRLEDYKKAGLPVLPVVKGNRTAKIQILVYTVAFVAASALLTVLGYAGYIYLAAIGIAGLYWLWHSAQGFAASDDTKWARSMFGDSLIVILVLSIALSVTAWLP